MSGNVLWERSRGGKRVAILAVLHRHGRCLLIELRSRTLVFLVNVQRDVLIPSVQVSIFKISCSYLREPGGCSGPLLHTEDSSLDETDASWTLRSSGTLRTRWADVAL